MRWLSLGLASLVAVVGVAAAAAQERVARVPAAASQAGQVEVSQGQAAIDRAMAAGKYAFIFFWREKNQQTDKAWSDFQPAMAKLAEWADAVEIQTTNAAEKHVVDRYGVSRAPMPLVLAIAPCGAITKGLTGKFGEQELRSAFVSPCTQLCLKALQSRKLVFVCVVDQAAPQDQVAVPQGVQDFKADQRYGPATEVVVLNARDQGEATFLKDLQVDSRTQKPLTVFLAPPGSLIGKFDGTATKQQLVAKLASAQSNPCAGGKCGPNGCGPKK